MRRRFSKILSPPLPFRYSVKAQLYSVSCKVSGKRQLLSLTIDKDAVDPEEVEMLQDMIVAAVNDALKKGEETRESEMSKIGGAGMGGMF